MSKNKILVVEDEKPIRDMYEDVFIRAGYEVKTAKSAEEALDILRHERYWVMFLDLKLPGMNGVDLCQQIRKDWATAICYAVTGYSSLFELGDCRDAGFEDYFIKPVKLSDLLEAAEYAFKKLARWKKE